MGSGMIAAICIHVTPMDLPAICACNLQSTALASACNVHVAKQNVLYCGVCRVNVRSSRQWTARAVAFTGWAVRMGPASWHHGFGAAGCSCQCRASFEIKGRHDWNAACKGTHCHLFRGKGKDSALGSVSDHTACSRWGCVGLYAGAKSSR
jgi:hypothetical protein